MMLSLEIVHPLIICHESCPCTPCYSPPEVTRSPHGLLHHTNACTSPKTTFPIIHCTNHTTVTNHSLHWLHSWIPSDTLYKPLSLIAEYCLPLPISLCVFLLTTWTVYTQLTVCCLPFWPCRSFGYSLSAACPDLCIVPVYVSALPTLLLLLLTELCLSDPLLFNTAAPGSQHHWPIITLLVWHFSMQNFKISALKIGSTYRPSADPDL